MYVPNSATWRDSGSLWRHKDGVFQSSQDIKLGKDGDTHHSTGNTQGTNLVNPSEDIPRGRHEHLAAEEIIRAECGIYLFDYEWGRTNTHRLLRPGWSECKSLMRKKDNQPRALKIQFTFTESINYVLGIEVTERINTITIYWKPVRKPRLQFSAIRIVMIVIIPEPIGTANSGSEITADPIRVSLRAFC